MPDAPSLAPPPAVRIADLGRVLRARWRVVLGFAAVVLAIAALVCAIRTPTFRARTVIAISPRVIREAATGDVVDHGARGQNEIELFARTELQVLASRSVREEVVRRYRALGFVDLPAGADGAAILDAAMRLEREETTQLVTITVDHPDATAAAVLANLVVDVYDDRDLALRQDAAGSATGWLEDRVGAQALVVRSVADAIGRFRARRHHTGGATLGSAGAHVVALNAALGAHTADVDLAATRVARREVLLAAGRWDVLAAILDAPALRRAERAWLLARADDADLAGRYGARHPLRVGVAARIAALVTLMRADVDQHLRREHHELDLLRARVASLRRAIDQATTTLLDEEAIADEDAALHVVHDRAATLHERLADRLDAVRLGAATARSRVRVIDAALPPSVPRGPGTPLTLALATLLGLAGGVALALVREALDDAVFDDGDVTDLDVPVLARIGAPRGDDDRRTFEAAHRLRAAVDHDPDGRSRRRLLVTSTISGEGRSTIARHLAIAFARQGRRVVLVDADLRRPSVARAFDADDAPGLADVLAGDVAPTAALVPTEVANLAILGAGRPVGDPAARLAGLDAVLDALQPRFDVVVIDGPPAGAIACAVTLAGQVDGVVLVVRAHSTGRALVGHVVARLRQVGIEPLGAVIVDAGDVDAAPTRPTSLSPLAFALAIVCGVSAALGTSLPAVVLGGAVAAWAMLRHPALATWLVFVGILLAARGVLDVGVLGLPLTLSKIAVVVALGVHLVRAGLTRGPLVEATPVTAGALAVLLSMGLSVIGSVMPARAFEPIASVGMLVVMLHVLYTMTPRAELPWLLRGITAAMVAMIAWTVFTQRYEAFFVTLDHAWMQRTQGAFGEPNVWGACLIVVCPLMIAAMAWDETLIGGVLFAALVALFPIAVLQSMSRAALLGFVAAIPGLVAIASRRRTLLLAALAVAVVVLPMVVNLDAMWLRYQTLADPTLEASLGHNSLDERKALLDAGLQMAREHGIRGVGAGMFPVYAGWISSGGVWKIAHNTYLTVLAEQGVFGLLAHAFFASQVVRAAWRTWRRGRTPRERAIGLGFLVGLLGFGTIAFTLNLVPFAMLWFTLALGLSVGRDAGQPVPSAASEAPAALRSARRPASPAASPPKVAAAASQAV